MKIQKILVTGANGQLGWELAQLAKQYPAFEFVFVDRSSLDLSTPETFEKIIKGIAPDCIINTAAYTAVDKAETEQKLAYTINADAVETFAKIAQENNIQFISFSTDYVFDGNATSPYLPDMPLQPVNYYGATKAAGEQKAFAANEHAIIIRTSWVFSAHGNNFVKTMLRLMKERPALNIVGDQKGRPTYARDLAMATMKIVEKINAGTNIKGIYHFANSGETTWFQFAEKIKQIAGLSCDVSAITTEQFPTPAKRPAYSVLNTQKIEQELNIQIPSWEMALEACIKQIHLIG
jgi:dTDP-4-dehydrorhamnose reductase